MSSKTNRRATSADTAAQQAADVADDTSADTSPDTASRVPNTFAGDIYKILKSCTPEQLDLTRQLAGAMLVDAYPKGETPAVNPYERRVLFACGHVHTVFVPTREPLQLERELASLRNGLCLNCLAVKVVDLRNRSSVRHLPERRTAFPELLTQPERRCYTLVREFVTQLIELPQGVREAVIKLSPSLRKLLDGGDPSRRLADDAASLRRLLYGAMPVDDAQLDTMDPYQRVREIERSLAVMRCLLNDLTRPPTF